MEIYRMSNIININDRETLNYADRRNHNKITIDADQLRKLVLTGSMLAQFLDMAMADNGQASVLNKLWHSQLEQFRREAQS